MWPVGGRLPLNLILTRGCSRNHLFTLFVAGGPSPNLYDRLPTMPKRLGFFRKAYFLALMGHSPPVPPTSQPDMAQHDSGQNVHYVIPNGTR